MGTLDKSQTLGIRPVVLEPGTEPFPIRHKLSKRGKIPFAAIQSLTIYSTVRSGTYLKSLRAHDLHCLIIFGTHCAHIDSQQPNKIRNFTANQKDTKLSN